MRYPDLADTLIVVLKKDARRDGLANRRGFEKMFQVHLRKTLRVGIWYELRDSIKNEIDYDDLYPDRSMPSVADPWFG